MLAIRPARTGGPEVLTLEDLPTPAPGPEEALLRVEAAGVNFIDIYHRTGQYPVVLPIPLGLEGAGIVEAVGEGTTGISVGQRVAWARGPGSYATHVVVPVSKLVPVPEGIEATTAAAAMLQGMTAHFLANATYRLGPGDECLVHAAAGGVGLLLCQMARRVGARVIGTASTEDKVKRARAAGAEEVILYTQTDFREATLCLTDGRGVDVVYDSVGKDTFDRSLGCLRRRGMLVLYGQSSGAVPPVNLQVLSQHGSLFVTRPTLFDYIATPKELRERADAVFGAIGRGELRIAIGETFPLSQAAEAHRRLGGRQTSGKVLLIP